MSGALILQDLRIDQGTTPVVALNQSVAPGEVLTIMGPSGSGKSTALSAILGTLAPAFRQQGRIILAGRDITALPPHQRRVGLLFQDDVLFPHLSVGANLAFALPPTIKGRAARRALVDAALDQAELSGFASRDPATLSGGQRARVALMRTLLAQPCALLLDEPFSRLDASLRSQIRSFVLSRIRQKGLAAILVTHDAEDAHAAGGPVISPLGQPVTL
ncbi:ATP-binding cassette domain-containing protein [Pseudotabrizicola algicola]|uniref:ATP-binding cassette domain-containing protein n=1 Tax=Pseudotabrizicola algicola TaxID=2709381 RepID=A0A6B3RI53_9RHOB|nr:ATP-binding cassette domain-containing protein [Pseudotabrizicola algicola]NEX44608.1 ATP-binding cassette domain-containing protein [Pseudotabrizicola algicola]